MRKILIINAHPSKAGLAGALTEAYHKGASDQGFKAQLIHLSDLRFDPILHQGYSSVQELEPDLERAQALISEADHLVFVTPVWWGSVPALFKGFLDRTFLPGFAFKYNEDNPWWEKLLKGRTSRIIVTSDGPVWWNRFVYGDPAINMLKKSVLEFCGFKVKVTKFGGIKAMNQEQIAKLIVKVRKLGHLGL